MILEALSATGLRSIRYAKEIPLVKSARHFHHVFVLISLSQIRDSERFVTVGHGSNDEERRAEWLEWPGSHRRKWTRRRERPRKG